MSAIKNIEKKFLKSSNRCNKTKKKIYIGNVFIYIRNLIVSF